MSDQDQAGQNQAGQDAPEFPSLINGRLQSDFINLLGVMLALVILLPQFEKCSDGDAGQCGAIGYGFAILELVVMAILIVSMIGFILAKGKMRDANRSLKKLDLNFAAICLETAAFAIVCGVTIGFLALDQANSHYPHFYMVPILIVAQVFVQGGNMFHSWRNGQLPRKDFLFELGVLVGVAMVAAGAIMALSIVVGWADINGWAVASAWVGGAGWTAVELFATVILARKLGKPRRGFDGQDRKPVSETELKWATGRLGAIGLAMLFAICTATFVDPASSGAAGFGWTSFVLACIGVLVGLGLAGYNLWIKLYGSVFAPGAVVDADDGEEEAPDDNEVHPLQVAGGRLRQSRQRSAHIRSREAAAARAGHAPPGSRGALPSLRKSKKRRRRKKSGAPAHQ